MAQPQGAKPPSSLNAFGKLIVNVITNPLVAASFAGIAYNLIFDASPFPKPIETVLHTVGAAFPPAALFLVGHGCIGSGANLRGGRFVQPLVLTVAKVVVTPIIMQELVRAISSAWPALNVHAARPSVHNFARKSRVCTKPVEPEVSSASTPYVRACDYYRMLRAHFR